MGGGGMLAGRSRRWVLVRVDALGVSSGIGPVGKGSERRSPLYGRGAQLR